MAITIGIEQPCLWDTRDGTSAGLKRREAPRKSDAYGENPLDPDADDDLDATSPNRAVEATGRRTSRLMYEAFLTSDSSSR